MYTQFWNLECQPFECDYDSRFFFRSRTHQAALLKLKYLVDSNKGAGLLIGETGAGKSSVTSMLASELAAEYSPVVTLHYPLLNPAELIAFLAGELGADAGGVQSTQPIDELLRSLKTTLRAHNDEGRHPVIVLDDAHHIEDARVFRTLQLVLNLRHETPFTVIMTGQPILLSRVAQVPELDQRIGAKSLLQPFAREETAEYIRHRLTVAGVESQVFSIEAMNEIHELSGGLPRQINRLADLALLVGYADRLSEIPRSIVSSAAAEVCSPALVEN